MAPATGRRGASAVAVDGRHIYWPRTSRLRAIGGANLDGSGVNLNFITGANAPAGVAVDAQHVYWTNIGDNTIGVANLDGTGVNQSLIGFADEPAELAVDGRHIYWTNFGGNTIGEANKDGTAVNEFFITGVDSPGGLAVDGSTSTGPASTAIRSGRRTWTAPASTKASSPAPTPGRAGGRRSAHLLDQLRQRPDRGGKPGRHRRQPKLHHRRHRAKREPGRVGARGASGLDRAAAICNTPQGSLSAPSTVTLRNTGQRSLSLTGLSFAGADPSDFLATTGACLGNIDPGHSCQLQAYFSPQGQGARSATLQIATNDYANSPLQVQLGEPAPACRSYRRARGAARDARTGRAARVAGPSRPDRTGGTVGTDGPARAGRQG